MNIFLNLNEKPYEDALLRGLSEISSGVCVSCAPDENYAEFADVIITDDASIYNDNHDKSLFIIPASFLNNEMCVAKEHIIYQTATVSEIYKRSVSLLEEITGCNYCSGLPGTAVSINVEGVCGGTGATSAALTLGRLLAAKRSKRVAYITDRPEESFEAYMNYVQGFLRPVSELDYLTNRNAEQKQRLISIRNYMAIDEYGLTVVKAGLNISDIVRLLHKTNEFDYIITDSHGLIKHPAEGSFNIKVSSLKDMRCRAKMQDTKTTIFSSGKLSGAEKSVKADGEIYICNFANASEYVENSLCIAYDEESFEKKGSKVNISLSSVFAIGLMPLLDILERKNSDGWN